MKKINIDLQNASRMQNLPEKSDFTKWVDAAFSNKLQKGEICIRLVSEKEITALNKKYRHKKGSTNILTFTYNNEGESMSQGDLVICASLVAKQAREQNKTFKAHFAHMVIHGCLHLQGFEHGSNEKAKKMEQLEIVILKKLGYSNPYV